MSKTTWKTIGYIALAILLIVCVLVDGLWVYIKFFADEITVVNTFYFSNISTVAASEEDADSAYIIELKYYTNDNNNGLEAIEIQFNQFSDETQALIYSYGVQLVINEDSTDDSLTFDDYQALAIGNGEFDYEADVYNYIYWYRYFNTMFVSKLASNGTYSFYESDDQFETFTISSSDSFLNDGLLITLSGSSSDEDDSEESELYRLSFQGEVYENEEDHTSSENYLYSSLYRQDFFGPVGRLYYTNYYFSYDIYYLVAWLYDKVSSASVGTDSAHWFKFDENMFSYEVYDSSTKQYILVGSDALADKVDTLNTTFGGIYVTKVADGLSSASQSMFNAVNGSAQYDNGLGDIDGDGESDVVENYFYGKTVVTCDVYDFEYVHLSGDYYELKLSESFINKYSSISGNIVLSIQLDLDVLDENNIKFYGFSSDSGLENFTVYECYTYTIYNGLKTNITGVDYA